MRWAKGQYILILIFLLAFIVRLGFVLQNNYIPSSDDYVYDRLGLSISQGKGYVNSDGTPHSFYPPFYPFFLSIIYTFFGHSYLAVRIVQSIIGAFTCVLIYLIGKKMYGIRLGTLAAFISTLYLPFIKSAGLLFTELIFTFLLCLIVFYLLKIQEEAQFKNCILLGLLLGVSFLTRATVLVFPLFIIPIFIYSGKGHPSDILKRYAVVLLFFIFSIAPWTVRNYAIFHKFVPIATQSGIGFYSSYRPADGIFGRLATADDPVIIEANRISSPVLRSNFLIKKTLDFIVQNPRKVLVLEVRKILYFWAPFDWEIVGGRWFNFVYVAMLPFLAFGFFLAVKEFRKNLVILLPVVYFQIMALIFYGSPRFRLPIEPFLFILAASGILQCWRWLFIKRKFFHA